MKKLKALILCFTCLVLCTPTTIAHGASGTIDVELKQHEELGSVSNVPFELYHVGDINEEEEPVLHEKFEIASFPTTASDIKETVNNLYAADKGAPVATGHTNMYGQLSLNVDEKGVYLLVARDNSYGIIEPSLVTFPCYEDIGVGMMPVYQVKVEPKAAKLDTPGIPETESPFVPPSASTSGKATSSSKTGDSLNIALYAGVAIASLSIFVMIKTKKRKESNA
ncbi:hypothetical protein M2146_001155 [Lachnospiraceae bacterium PF1-22]